MIGPAGTFQAPKAGSADAVRIVELIAKRGGLWHARCPHCRSIVGLAEASVRGKQFTDQACGGMLEVSSVARTIRPDVFF